MRAAPGSWLTTVGLASTLLGVCAGVGAGGDSGSLVLGLAGVLVGAAFIAAGVRRTTGGEQPAPRLPRAACARVGALTALLRRNAHVVGLALSSSAITGVAGGEAGPAASFAMFALLLLGLRLVNIHILLV